MNSLNQSTVSFGSSIGQRDEELDTCSIISFGSHRSANKTNSAIKNHHQQLEIKVETVYSLLSMLTYNNIKEEMCNKFYSMSLDKRISLEMRSHGCIPLLIQLIHPIGEDTRFHENDEATLSDENADDDEYQGKQFNKHQDPVEENIKELEIRTKACTALRNIIKHNEDTKVGKREMRVLQLLEEIRSFCDKFKRSKGDLSVSMSHPGEATSHLMKISFDEEHRVAICLLGGLHAIAELIFFDTKYHGNTTSTQCITVRRYAFMALTNLTFGDGTNKSILCSNKLFISSLIEQLYSPSEELHQVTASVLRNLSWKADDQGKDTLREMGAVRMLMRVALDSRKESTLKSILTALWNLSAHSTANKAEICAVEGALKFLISTLNYQSMSNTMVIIENGGGILRNVSSYIARHEHLRAILREHDCLAILLEQLKSPSLTIVSNACATLWNLSARCLQDQLKLIELGAVPMLRNLVNSKHKMISMGSAAALKNLSSVKTFHDADSSCSSSRNSSCSSSASHGTGVPSLHARKAQNTFKPELDDSLSETCDNLESPKSSPKHRRFGPPPTITRYGLPDRMHMSFTAPTFSNPYPHMSKSSSKDSLGSTHSEPVYHPFNSVSSSPSNNHYYQQHFHPRSTENTLPHSSSHGLYPPTASQSPVIHPNYPNDLSHLFHAYPIRINDANSEKNKSSSIRSDDSLDKRIIDMARRNVENILISQNGGSNYFTKNSTNSLSSGIKCKSDDNVTAGLGQNFLEQPQFLRRKSSEGTICLENHQYTPQNGQFSSKIDLDGDSQQNGLKLFIHTNRLQSSNNNSLRSPRSDNISNIFSQDINNCSDKKNVKGEAIEEETEESLKKEEESSSKNLILPVQANVSNSNSLQTSSFNYGENCITSFEATPLMFSRTSSLGSLSGLEAKSFNDDQSSVPSEFSKGASDPVSPTDIPDSPTQTESITCISNNCQRKDNETDELIDEKQLVETRGRDNWTPDKNSPYPVDSKMIEEKLEPIQARQNANHAESIFINEIDTQKRPELIEITAEESEITQKSNDLEAYSASLYINEKTSFSQTQESISLYSIESQNLDSIKPPSCIDEASLNLESSNFPSMEFNTTKPDPPKVISVIPSTEARKIGIDNFLESTNPPSDMDQISGLSSSYGSLNSLDSETVDIPVIKDFDLEATELIKQQTQNIIQLTESHNDQLPSDIHRPTLQRNDTFNYDGQNESEDDSRATYICSPRRARIVKPVLRSQSSGNCVRRVSNSISSSNDSLNPTTPSLIAKSRFLVIKGTKTTALRVSRSKPTLEGSNENNNGGTSTSVPSTPAKKPLPSSNGNSYSNKTFVIRKKIGLQTNTAENTGVTGPTNNIRSRSLSANKLCNSASIHNIVDKMTCSPSPSSPNHIHTSSLSSSSSYVKKTPVQSKIASLWKRSIPEKENITNLNNTANSDNHIKKSETSQQTAMSKSCKGGGSAGAMKSASQGRITPPSSLTRSSTYEKLPSSPSEAMKMQAKLPDTMSTKETKEISSSRASLTKSRVRPTQDQIAATSLKATKFVRLEKRKTSLVN